MPLRITFIITVTAFVFISGNLIAQPLSILNGNPVAKGQMPQLTKDKMDNLHLVYGTGDSIMYGYSDNGGQFFSHTTLVARLPGLAASHTRGPQIAATSRGIIITACSKKGNIYSFIKEANGNWIQTAQVNDRDTIAKENLMALAADGNRAFATWLDLRDGHNKIYGAWSSNGGKTWSKNIMVYASPDKTVCECCKPSVAMMGSKVYVMYRNWLKGNRDLYLISSDNGGKSFGKAKKLGTGSWALKGCPMDGGGLALNKKGSPQTVWNRSGIIYACVPGKQEVPVGKGRSCTVATLHGSNVYAWVENGEIVVSNAQGPGRRLGKGQLPVLITTNDERVVCVWESEKTIMSALFDL